MKKQKYISTRRKRRGRICFVISIAIFVLVTTMLLKDMNDKAMPVILAVAENAAKSNMNTAMNRASKKILEEMNVSAPQFYEQSLSGDGKMSSLSVNTVLINEICSALSAQITDEFSAMGHQRIDIPMGALMGLGIFANVGPTLPVTLVPVGVTQVDYNTNFESVGINQVNFQVWVYVDSYVQIVNPIQNREIAVSRKFALVNTVFSGQVPQMYMNGMPSPR